MTLLARARLAAGLLLAIGAASIGFAQSPLVQIAGAVVDSTGAVLPAAHVELLDNSGTVQSITTNDVGAFTFEAVRPGTYTVRASLDGFETESVGVVVGTRALKRLRIALPLAGLHQEVTVTGAAAQVTTAAKGNADTVSVSQSTLENLPIFDDDAVAAVSRFLDNSALGTGGVTILVNGMEVNSLNVSTSAIEQIKINQDPYSAAFSRPGRGRIDILTKPGSQEYHGSANVVFRDSALNARNAFADIRPPEQRRIADAFLGGPVGRSRATSFMFSAKDDSEDRQAIVFALGPDGDIRDAVAQPYRHLLGSLGITHQRGASTISVRPSFEAETNDRGAGGTTLGSAATRYYHREASVTYRQQTVIRPTVLNQFQMLVGHEFEPTTSASAAPGIVVNGAFTGGGAQVDLRRTELHLQLAENVAITTASHFLQFGFQVPDWSRRGFHDRSGFGGTFYFSDLDAYAAGRPYAFIQQRGNGNVVWLEKVLGAYASDDWQIGPKATLSVGLRYDWSNYFEDHDTFAPRFSLAIKPGGGDSTVLRGGGGIFYDKIGPFPVIDVLNFRAGGLQRIVVTDPSYPSAFDSALSTAAPPSIAQFAPGIQVPWTFQYSAGVERQLLSSATLSIMYYGSNGRLLRSRDVNAPLTPLYAARPNPSFGAIRQIESTGRQRSDSLQASIRGRFGRLFNGQVQYALSRTLNDSGGLNWYPANDYDLAGEWARADFDRRHRLVLLGSVSPGRQFNIGLALTLQSGAPYTALLGTDPFNNGRGNARPPGVPRNSLQAAGTSVIDLRLSRDFPFGPPAANRRRVTVGVDAFNLTNAVNYGTYVGTVTSPLFGHPVTADAPRQLQLSVRVNF